MFVTKKRPIQLLMLRHNLEMINFDESIKDNKQDVLFICTGYTYILYLIVFINICKKVNKHIT